jgi:hypothetical protein
MYFNVMTMTVMVILTCCFSLKEKQKTIAAIGAKLNTWQAQRCAYRQRNKHVLTRRLEYPRGTCQNTIPWQHDIQYFLPARVIFWAFCGS